MASTFFLSLPLETLIGLAIIVVAFLWLLAHHNHKTAAIGPSFLMTLGILGTFIGITLGLLNFDTHNMQQDLPNLLNGLKTAFIVSAAAICGSIILKIRMMLFGVPRPTSKGPATTGATVDDLAQHLQAIQKGLVGTDESTLITQIKLGRQDANDRLDHLSRTLEAFGRTMAENNSKALITALEEVMRDFNAKINEQFGENFKQLNEAVGAILVWQERYRDQMEQMIALQDRSTQSLDLASQRFETVVSNAETYTRTAQDLATLLQAIEYQRQSLHDSMEALGALFVAASRSLPEIENRIVDFADQIARSTQIASAQMLDASNTSASTMRAAVEQTVTSATQQLDALKDALRTVEVTTLASAQAIGDGALRAQDMMVRGTQEQTAALSATLLDARRAVTDEVAETRSALLNTISDAQTLLNDGLKTANVSLNRQMEEMIQTSKEQSAALSATLSEAGKAVMGDIADTRNALLKTITDAQTLLNDGLRTANDGLNGQMQDMVQKTKEQVAALDLALTEELTASLTSLGRQLTALSQQFVNDYRPLTDKLRDLVAVASRV